MDKKFKLIWECFSVDSPFANMVDNTDEELYLPFLIAGDELTKIENNEVVAKSELQIAKGILMVWNSTGGASIMLDLDQFKPTYVNIMNKFKSAFGFDDMETFITNVVQLIHDEIGNYAACRARKGALGILPDNSKIISDIIINSWMILETEDSADRPSLFKDIVKYYKGIKFEDFDPFRTEVLDYTYLVSLSQLGQHRLKERFYEDVAVNRIKHDLLKELAENAMKIKDISFEELKVPAIFFRNNNSIEDISPERHDEYYAKGYELIEPFMEIEDDSEKILNLSDIDNIRRGINYLDAVTTINPKNYLAFHLKGFAYRSLDDSENAYINFNSSFEIHKEDLNLIKDLLFECLKSGKGVEGVEIAKYALSLEPDDLASMYFAGIAFLIDRNLEAAENITKKALETYPNDDMINILKEYIAEVKSGHRELPQNIYDI